MEKCGVGSLLHFCEFLCYHGSKKGNAQFILDSPS